MIEEIEHINQSTDWGQIIISAFSILTSIMAIIISVITYKSQVRHNKNSVKPILDIICGDYEDDIYVRIDNNGVGPAVIKSILCSNGCAKKDCLVKLIPSKVSVTTQNTNILVSLSPLTDFVEEMAGRTIAPERKVVLLELLEPDSIKRVALRTILREITIHIEYTDIYGEEVFVAERELTFFGRTLPKTES